MEIKEINYPWDWAPDWAQYVAVDENGDAYWFEKEPKIVGTTWSESSGFFCKFGNSKLPVDWTKSLEKRPNFNYPWSDAPDWAQWAATDENGRAYWFEKKPITVDFVWTNYGGQYGQLKNYNYSENNWTKSLQKRPK